MNNHRQYRMNEAVGVAVQAATDIEAWLRLLPNTVSVRNVEDDQAFQQRDIDLIWQTQGGAYEIEVKGDRWDRTGNFFLETHSNEERGTPGCFLYTEADYVFYYFVKTHVLYILPMPETRTWFLTQMDTFRERRTTTPVGRDAYYTTVGRLVPIQTVLAAIPRARKEQLPR